MSGQVGDVPADVVADAKDRSWRTLLQGLGIDVATGIVVTLAVALTDIEWTREYWLLLGSGVAKSALQAAVSFFMRLLVKPKSG